MEKTIKKLTAPESENAATLLKACPIFSWLDEKGIEELINVVYPMRFQAGKIIIQEKEIPGAMYIIQSGRVKILMSSESGKEYIIDTRRKGETFNDIAALDGQPSFASAQAIEDTAVLAIKSEDLIDLVGRHPALISRIACVAGDRLRNAYTNLISLAVETVDQRLVKILLVLSSKYGPTLNFNRSEIAEMAGTTIETATRILTKLEESGLVSRKRGEITLLDNNQLKSLIGQPLV
jgi:CRP-like cAMP-binding protein